MLLREALAIDDHDIVAVIGAGGKTSAVRRLAVEFHQLRRRVLVLSTTKIEAQRGAIDTQLCDSLATACAAARSRRAGDLPLLIVTEQLPTRLRGVPVDWVAPLAAWADVTLVQADGAGRRSFKAPAAHEPVIPAQATLVAAVAGIDAIGKPIDERHMHRPERVAEFAGVALGTPLTIDAAARVLLHPRGGFRDVSPATRRAIVLNRVDGQPELDIASSLTAAIRTHAAILVIATALQSPDPVRAVWGG
ncbi:MAG: putative selenium-dependent hydroxylase accessory protein YqeC [Deltaproteobacteria bacterium]|nr:putative selenium-dependent hydroxylase accessory protein YqeC [Deltaproteobacteria bacterium]MBI3391156.1 putative selenium-dependent hydroxylase accessory protein YqeC [Deltaproteobacteria bacterium]